MADQSRLFRTFVEVVSDERRVPQWAMFAPAWLPDAWAACRDDDAMRQLLVLIGRLPDRAPPAPLTASQRAAWGVCSATCADQVCGACADRLRATYGTVTLADVLAVTLTKATA